MELIPPACRARPLETVKYRSERAQQLLCPCCEETTASSLLQHHGVVIQCFFTTMQISVMRLSLEEFGFVSPPKALWSCQMAAVSGRAAENLPAPSQHWWVSSPNRQGASHWNSQGRKTPFRV